MGISPQRAGWHFSLNSCVLPIQGMIGEDDLSDTYGFVFQCKCAEQPANVGSRSQTAGWEDGTSATGRELGRSDLDFHEQRLFTKEHNCFTRTGEFFWANISMLVWCL